MDTTVQKIIAWDKQSKSLVQVQKMGGDLEKRVAGILAWGGGRVKYDFIHQYTIQVDNVFPNSEKPEVVLSVTYTSPDQKGHSNENKLHLKVGELALLKYAYPDIRMVLVLGGTQEAWLPYVLTAFDFFYDEVIYLWEENGAKRLLEIKEDPLSIKVKHINFWEKMRNEWSKTELHPLDYVVPKGLVRYKILDALKNQKEIVHHPSLIKNEIARLCMQRSRDNNGAEWDSYLEGRWSNIEMSRNFFNPVEATIEITLIAGGLKFQGGVSRDIAVPSLLHDLGLKGTRVSEDFVLFSKKLNIPVYIQCKSSGGGIAQHGKNIQNRTKEQITRSIIYRSRSDGKQLFFHPKNFHWISVLDGDWSVNTKNPVKYIHMLQLAGYDKIFRAEDLLDDNFEVKRENNPLLEYLKGLDCEKI